MSFAAEAAPVVIVGCGDTGRWLARDYAARGTNVTAVVRSQQGAERARDAGIADVRIHDLDQRTPGLSAAIRAAIPGGAILHYMAPPPRAGEDEPRLAALIDALGTTPVQRLVYISTSGVYGDCGGDWVDETRPVNPQTARATRRVAAEQRLAQWGGPWVLLRAPGIYGPGRLPLARVRAGEPILCDADAGWSNRIHVHDLAGIALAAGERGPAQCIYNASDDRPTRMGPYYRRLAHMLGVAPPPEVDWATAQREFSPMRLSFLSESRRLDNRRLRQTLGYALRYPDYEAGLAGSMAT